MGQTTAEKVLKYKVKDISLAEWGRKEIKLAEQEKKSEIRNPKFERVSRTPNSAASFKNPRFEI